MSNQKLPRFIMLFCFCSCSALAQQQTSVPAASAANQSAVMQAQDQTMQASGGLSCPPSVVHVGHDIKSLAFSPDGQWLASGGNDKKIIVWNTHTGNAERAWDTGQPVLQVVFNPNGKQLASFNQLGKIEVRDFQNGTVLYTLMGGAVAYSPDGKTLATGGYRSLTRSEQDHSGDSGYSSTVGIHDAASGKVLRTIDISHFNIYALAITRDGILFVGSCNDDDTCDGTVGAWSLASGKFQKSYDFEASRFSPDGQWLASLTNGELSLFNASNDAEKKDFPLRDTRTQASAMFSPNGQEIAVAQDAQIKPGEYQYQSTIDIWDIETEKKIVTLKGTWKNMRDNNDVRVIPKTSPSAFGPLAFSPDGKLIAAANYTFETQKEISCDSRRSTVTTWYHLIKIWDVATGRELLTLPNQPSANDSKQ